MKRLVYLSTVIVLLIGLLPATATAAPPQPGPPGRPDKLLPATRPIPSGPAVASAPVGVAGAGPDVLLVHADYDSNPSDPSSGVSAVSWTAVDSGHHPALAAHGGSKVARFNSWEAQVLAEARLYTGPLNWTGYTAPQLTFYMSHDPLSSKGWPDQLQIQVSKDRTNWVNVGDPLLRYDGSLTQPTWRQHTVDLSIYAGEPSIYISFLGISYFTNDIYLDDIELSDGGTHVWQQGFEDATFPPSGWTPETVHDRFSPMQYLLGQYGDLGTIALFDANSATPTLDQLKAYDVVVTWSGWGTVYVDPDALGDALHAYVGAGGKVVNLQGSMWQVTGNALAGDFVPPATNADIAIWKTTTDVYYQSSCLGTHDAADSIMKGITPGNVCDYSGHDANLSLTSGSRDVAWWQSIGSPPAEQLFVAVNAAGTVVSINRYLGFYSDFYGQNMDVLHNAILWLAPPSPPENQPPTVTCPAASTPEATGAGGASVTIQVTVGDADNDPLTAKWYVDDMNNAVATHNLAAGATTDSLTQSLALGAHTVRVSVSDGKADPASCDASVTVQDTTPPTIDSHADVTAQATSASGANVSYISPATHDLVDGAGTATCLPASGSLFPLGNTTVTCNAMDAHNNAAVAKHFVVHVVTAAPTLSQLAQSSATCRQFKAGTAADLSQLLYTVNRYGMISAVTPGTLAYFAKVTAPNASAFNVLIAQSNGSGFPAMTPATCQVMLYDGNCNLLSSRAATVKIESGRNVRINFAAGTSGRTIYVMVKYPTTAAYGRRVTKPYPTVNYTFRAAFGASSPFSQDSLALKPQ